MHIVIVFYKCVIDADFPACSRVNVNYVFHNCVINVDTHAAG